MKTTLKQTITISNKLGLHARAATKLSNTANKFESHIQIDANGKKVDAKSIISLMLLAATKDTDIQLNINGNDAQQAMVALCELIDNKFGEGE